MFNAPSKTTRLLLLYGSYQAADNVIAAREMGRRYAHMPQRIRGSEDRSEARPIRRVRDQNHSFQDKVKQSRNATSGRAITRDHSSLNCLLFASATKIDLYAVEISEN